MFICVLISVSQWQPSGNRLCILVCFRIARLRQQYSAVSRYIPSDVLCTAWARSEHGVSTVRVRWKHSPDTARTAACFTDLLQSTLHSWRVGPLSVFCLPVCVSSRTEQPTLKYTDCLLITTRQKRFHTWPTWWRHLLRNIVKIKLFQRVFRSDLKMLCWLV